MLDALPSTPLDASLAVVDPLVPPSVQYRSLKFTNDGFDTQGLTKYARIVHGLLLHLVNDRQTARENLWVLHHFLALALYAEESKHLPAAESPVFSKTVPRATLQGILDRVQQATAYLLSSTTDEKWHTTVTNALVNQAPATGLDGVGQLVVDLVNRTKRYDTIRESRILHMILRHALSTATKADSEQWMLVARKLEKLGKQHLHICAHSDSSADAYITYSTPHISCYHLLRYPLRPRADAARALPQRARSGHARHSRV